MKEANERISRHQHPEVTLNMRRLFSKFRANSAPYSPRPWRPQWLPRWAGLQSEASVHPHIPEERADLFLSHDAGSTEIEVLNWLYATICLLKPQTILETGAARGLGTLALAAACKANGFGHVHSVEIEPRLCERLTRMLCWQRLSRFVTVHCDDSRNFLRDTPLTFDFAFFDSLWEIRIEEYRICHERRILNGVAVFHDTSPTRTPTKKDPPHESLHREYRQKIYEIAKQPGKTGYFESPLSRGLIVIFPEQNVMTELAQQGYHRMK